MFFLLIYIITITILLSTIQILITNYYLILLSTIQILHNNKIYRIFHALSTHLKSPKLKLNSYKTSQWAKMVILQTFVDISRELNVAGAVGSLF